MFDFLEKIQKKPEYVRKRILAATVALIMAVIIVLWFNDLKTSFATKEEKDSRPPGPFSVFREAISNSVETLKAEINK